MFACAQANLKLKCKTCKSGVNLRLEAEFLLRYLISFAWKVRLFVIRVVWMGSARKLGQFPIQI